MPAFLCFHLVSSSHQILFGLNQGFLSIDLINLGLSLGFVQAIDGLLLCGLSPGNVGLSLSNEFFQLHLLLLKNYLFFLQLNLGNLYVNLFKVGFSLDESSLGRFLGGLGFDEFCLCSRNSGLRVGEGCCGRSLSFVQFGHRGNLLGLGLANFRHGL